MIVTRAHISFHQRCSSPLDTYTTLRAQAAPDILAAHADTTDRGMKSLPEALKGENTNTTPHPL